MRAGDFRPCVLCGKGVAHTGLPLFFRVKIERMGIDGRAIQQTHGMEQFMGGHVALARVFHDPEIAKPITEVTGLVCEECAMVSHPLAMLSESAHEKADAEAAKHESAQECAQEPKA